ncbi:hypothetical protein [Azospirillum picis]|uniref:Uncharacterized protein n=1 Tax=Azospirillum picis TaxID=488438 RepID=A0ABU0MV53_9PROT|nr:hypothetical protein [Azospirillum picis]MBP2303466.1 hypothetical protein [Azospirillum picis]MDQ0537345.1 hypothetical protein [Azospirillum picis]
MADDNRPNLPRDLNSQDLAEMTKAYLEKGGTIVRCPPGASENVVYRRGSFRRRNDGEAKPQVPAPSVPAQAKPEG